jgi:hypothetical protein
MYDGKCICENVGADTVIGRAVLTGDLNSETCECPDIHMNYTLTGGC